MSVNPGCTRDYGEWKRSRQASGVELKWYLQVQVSRNARKLELFIRLTEQSSHMYAKLPVF